MGLQIVAYGLLEFMDASKGSPSNAPIGDLCEEAFDEVEPGRAGRGEVHVPVRASGEPVFDFGRLVCGVIVHDKMHVQVLGNVGFDGLEKPEELLLAVVAVTRANYFSRGHVQRGKERSGTVAHVVVASSFGIARRHGQQRLGAIEGLNLFDS